MKTSLFIKQAFGTLLFFAIIFISAGSLFYCQGWVYVIIGFSILIAQKQNKFFSSTVRIQTDRGHTV